MDIVLARIDDRLIHGQVVTNWVKETKCDRVIVCNDDIAADVVRKTLIEQVVPAGVKANVVSIEKMVRVYNNPAYKGVKVLLLFTNPTDVLRLVEMGVDIKSVNVGGMSYKSGKKQITGVISVDEKDVQAFKSLDERGIEIEGRQVSSDFKLDVMAKIKEHNLL
ncbi:mannose/fructose/sorbose PTS transporter subunit IIB [Tepidimicrobium xylanilyticum]|uniref:PTS system, mannose-specific IIB component n=1 Tax=Tepidimicrobium xylanilyticum TaxID=1123352 RepID=A0A1H2WDJ2_9FIRM|nr:mannose/fructose/sorbose PTS transporter subunit IIB [Tepidimicrobium xylanilyticum]GMG95275.1 hypothetical protein EN5CB1_01010 [Tepidimicrobium xylanilyticum]SDW78598.1 PTS system, mannose-specific IIB component [Tepidimicrobium xylanilyticum]